MDKNYTDTPLLDEVIYRVKERARKKLIIALTVCGIIGIAITLACIAFSSGIEDIIASWILPVIFALCFLWPYHNAVITNERMKKQLRCTSDAVLENSLQRSEKLDEYVYLSDEYILDFNLGQAAKLSEISSVKKYMQMELRGYAVKLWTSYGFNYALFKTRQQRTDAIEKINEAVSRVKKDYQY